MKEVRDPTAADAERARRGLSYHELGILAGCSRSMAHAVIANRKRCSDELAQRLAKALGVRTGHLFQASVSSGAQPIDPSSAVA